MSEGDAGREGLVERSHRGVQVGVVITVYNGERHIARAIDSLLRQTMSDWHCVVVDDGSTDGTGRLLEQVDDARVSVIRSPRVGRIRALNQGCNRLQSEYIAILDADDIAEPKRFELQAAFLDESPGVGLVASYVNFKQEASGTIRCFRPPLRNEELRRQMSRVCPFAHSSVMFRKSLWEQVGGYSKTLSADAGGEDYNLYIDLMHISKVAVLPDVLVTCSIHDGQIYRANTRERTRARAVAKLRLKAVRTLHRPAWELIFGTALWVYSFLCDNRLIAAGKRDLVDRTLLKTYWRPGGGTDQKR